MSEPCRVITEEQYQDYLRSKEQIKEANKIIKECSDYCNSINFYDVRDEEIALYSKYYLKKWGVK